MSTGLPIGYLILTIGTFQFMLGLAFVAANAWKSNPIIAILAIIFPPAAMFWALGPYKRNTENKWQAMFITTMYIAGLSIVLLAMCDIYVHSYNLTYMGFSG